MRYDFDRLIDRRNTNSLKFDFAVAQGRPADVLPLWVADHRRHLLQDRRMRDPHHRPGQDRHGSRNNVPRLCQKVL